MPSSGPDHASVSAEVHLPPEAASASEARRWLRGHLGGWPDAVVGDAELLVSEAVTNAVLHARTPVSVRLRSGEGRLRLEVADRDPGAPVLKRFSSDATTGRGLQLLATLAASWGVEREGAGKRVWFELDAGPAGRRPGGAVPVRILGLPVRVYLAAEEHHDALLREFALLAAESDGPEPPRRLLAVAAEVTERFAYVAAEVRSLVQAAVQRGQEDVDLVYDFPLEGGDAILRVADELDEIDRWCEEGDLLTIASPPEVRRFRTWYTAEVRHQLAGGTPRPWPPGWR